MALISFGYNSVNDSLFSFELVFRYLRLRPLNDLEKENAMKKTQTAARLFATFALLGASASALASGCMPSQAHDDEYPGDILGSEHVEIATADGQKMSVRVDVHTAMRDSYDGCGDTDTYRVNGEYRIFEYNGTKFKIRSY